MKSLHTLLLMTLLNQTEFADNQQADNIWDGQPPFFPENTGNTPGCRANMRLFGMENRYKCRCEELTSCNFRNNGHCGWGKCQDGYGGPFCQKIRYGSFLKNYVNESQNVFKEEKIMVYNPMNITFRYKYKIHLIKMNCKSAFSDTVSLYIGSEKFCEEKCRSKITCNGDIMGKSLSIETASQILVSEMKVYGCSPYWYGENCEKRCHCANNADCNKIDGRCYMGCEDGRSGRDCQTLNYENVALNKSASQSSTYTRSRVLVNDTCRDMDFSFSANLAVDGNTDQQNERHSCMHTMTESRPYWTVDLGREYNISQIRIYGRKEEPERLNGAIIYVDAQWCKMVNKGSEIMDINCTSIIRGREIKIFRRYSLNFCEVEVLQCLHSFYGYRCSKNCSPLCKNSSCDQWSGHCKSGCIPGYKLNFIKECKACGFGTFGDECSKTCRCEDNYQCAKENGTCRSGGCEIGYQGHNCQEECSFGTFGKGCLKECHCKNDSYCNKANGICISGECEAGYRGSDCQQPKEHEVQHCWGSIPAWLCPYLYPSFFLALKLGGQTEGQAQILGGPMPPHAPP